MVTAVRNGHSDRSSNPEQAVYISYFSSLNHFFKYRLDYGLY